MHLREEYKPLGNLVVRGKKREIRNDVRVKTTQRYIEFLLGEDVVVTLS